MNKIILTLLFLLLTVRVDAWDLTTCSNVKWIADRDTCPQFVFCSYYGANWCACADLCSNGGITPPPPPCVPDGSCNNLNPACGQTVTCTDNCGTVFTKTGSVCCVSDGSCNAPTPLCGETTTGTDNCLNPCTKTGSICSRYYMVGNRCKDRTTGQYVPTAKCKR